MGFLYGVLKAVTDQEFYAKWSFSETGGFGLWSSLSLSFNGRVLNT